MVRECPYLAGCPFYEFAKLKGTKRALVAAFCRGTYETCARYKLRSTGQPVPKGLWPDGEMAQEGAAAGKSFASA